MYYEGPIQALIFPVVNIHDVNQKFSLSFGVHDLKIPKSLI
jgi:hypothetical protein